VSGYNSFNLAALTICPAPLPDAQGFEKHDRTNATTHHNFKRFSMRVVTSRQMQELDRRAINDIGIPGIELMENAGRGTFEQIKRSYPELVTKKIVVLCGRGNNGGDGFVIARHCCNAGASVHVVLLAGIGNVTGDAQTNLHAYQQLGGVIREVIDEAGWDSLTGDILHADLIVDALLGTGLSSDVTGVYKRAINFINSLTAPIVAVDIPSGIDATTGRILGAAVRAQLTCTFGLPKRGLLLFPGASHAGRLEVIDIGIPASLIVQEENMEMLLERNFFKGVLPRRDADTHKGSYGHVFVIAGSPGKTGAAAMAAQAALRTGAGLVTLGVPRTLNSILAIKVTEAMTEPLPDFGEGFLGITAWPKVKDILKGKSVIALGPGLSERDETAQFTYRVLEEAMAPLVIDADGLNAIAKKITVLKNIKAPAVLTPHPGEMGRLMGRSTQAIQMDRIESARAFSLEHGVIVVLKGARTVIAEPGGAVYINPTGNPGMASGGMGDVLTGMIAGLVAQGLEPLQAAQLAVFTHGHIGDGIAAGRAPIGILATDIIEGIPGALKHFIGF
jgi:ADP-dependent NAD(P)H-hydrate dehydratase / NAD(P)H-hydrate epimerase